MSVTIRTISASVNVPKPTASSTFDDALESYLSKAIATGETSGIHGIIQGFKLYPNPELNNSWVLTATPSSLAVFRNPSGGDFLYLETTRSFGFTIGPEFDGEFGGGAAIACLVPDFVAKRISLVLYTIEDQIFGEIPESSVLLGVLISIPESPAPGFAAVYSGILPLGEEELVPFRRTQYDPGKKLTAVYTESFVGVSPSSWVTTSGSYSTINDSDLGGAGKAIRLVLGEGESATITFPHVMTPYYDNHNGDLVNANNKVRAKVTYYTSEDFVNDNFEAVFVNQSGASIEPISGAYWIPTPISSPRSFYVEISPDPEDQQSDGNYRLRLTGDFTGSLYITGVEFEVDLDSSGRYLTNVIYVPSAGGGGGGVTVIPDGGTISGVYQGDVLCEGGVTFADNVTIYGSLNTKQGICVNTEGYGLVVGGNWLSDAVDFNVGEGGIQYPIRIDGDWIFREVDIEYTNASGGIGYQGVIVSGDLIGTDYEDDSTYFRIDGLLGNRGGHVYVHGNVSLYHFSARGGGSTETLAAGEGGYLTVQGNLKCRDLFFEGGDSSFADMDAGAGGEVDVEGDLFADDIRLQGGDSNLGGNAGNGGTLAVRGSAYADEVDIFGGYCNSDSPDYRAGNGGYLSVRGQINIDECSLIGGDRSGTLASANSLAQSNGGNVDCGSNAYFDNLYVYGGSVYTTNHAPQAGGNGGSVTITGNLFVEYFSGNGGQSNLTSYTGNGSYVYVGGSLQTDNFYFEGGVANSGVSGNGGQLYVGSDISVTYSIFGFGGSGDGAFCSQGGNGAYINSNGNIKAESIYIQGGDCNNCEMNDARGGLGGTLSGYNITIQNDINVSGGSIANSSAVPLSPPAQTPNAGQVTAYGNLIVSTFDGNGGNSFTGAASCPGGNGAEINVRGILVAFVEVSLNGGTGTGRTGGNGGIINAESSVNVVNLEAIGGDSIGDAPVTAGRGGNITIKGGGKCSNINMADGIGGSAPTEASLLVVGGTFTAGVVTLSDRVNAQLKPYSDFTTILKLVSMPDKSSLTSDSGVDTDPISPIISDSIFLSTASGDWVVLQGIPISTT